GAGRSARASRPRPGGSAQGSARVRRHASTLGGFAGGTADAARIGGRCRRGAVDVRGPARGVWAPRQPQRDAQLPGARGGAGANGRVSGDAVGWAKSPARTIVNLRSGASDFAPRGPTLEVGPRGQRAERVQYDGLEFDTLAR